MAPCTSFLNGRCVKAFVMKDAWRKKNRYCPGAAILTDWREALTGKGKESKAATGKRKERKAPRQRVVAAAFNASGR
jgi:hypothetical protein